MRKGIKTAVFLALAVCMVPAVPALAGGNKALMERAEKRLRALNDMVLARIAKEDIPKNGRIEIKAAVTLTEDNPEIQLKEIKITSADDPEIILKRITLVGTHEVKGGVLPVNKPVSEKKGAAETKAAAGNVKVEGEE